MILMERNSETEAQNNRPELLGHSPAFNGRAERLSNLGNLFIRSNESPEAFGVGERESNVEYHRSQSAKLSDRWRDGSGRHPRSRDGGTRCLRSRDRVARRAHDRCHVVAFELGKPVNAFES